MSDAAVLDRIDPRALRDCCGRFATGVTVITTRTADGDHGMTASAFMSVSLDPPLISICLDRRSKMLGEIRKSGRYAVNILSRDLHPYALHFAGKPDATLPNMLDDRHGLPVLRGAAAVMVADVVKQVEAGDHVLFLGHVKHLDHDPEADPLLFHAGQFGSLSADLDG